MKSASRASASRFSAGGGVEDSKDKCDILIVSSRNYATFDSNFKGYNPIIHQKERYDDYADLTDFVKKVIADI